MSSSGPAGALHRGHGITSGFAQALQTVQADWTGAKQCGHTIWWGWAREQNGQAAEFSSTRFPQKRQGRLYPGIVPGWAGSYFVSVHNTTRSHREVPALPRPITNKAQTVDGRLSGVCCGRCAPYSVSSESPVPVVFG